VANGIPRQLQLLQMAQTLAEGFLIQFGEEIEGQIQAPEFRKVSEIHGGNLRNGVLAGIAIKRGRISIFSMGNPKGKTQVLAYMLTTLDNTSSPNSSSRQLVICCSSQRTFRLCMFSDILRQLHQWHAAKVAGGVTFRGRLEAHFFAGRPGNQPDQAAIAGQGISRQIAVNGKVKIDLESLS